MHFVVYRHTFGRKQMLRRKEWQKKKRNIEQMEVNTPTEENATVPREIPQGNGAFFRRMKLSSLSITVEPVLFAYMMGVFMQYPVFQMFMYYKVCIAYYHNKTICTHLEDYKDIRDDVQNKDAVWIMLFMICITIPSVISASIMGSWGDHFGRKWTMLLPNVGNVIIVITIILSIHFIESHIAYLLVGAVVSGFFGGFATMLLSVFSYMSDITTAENRTLRISVLESMTAIGGTVGLLLGPGILQLTGNFMLVFGICFALYIFIVIYVLLRIRKPREALADMALREDNGQNMCKLLFNVKHVKDTIMTNFKRRPNNHHIHIFMLNISMFLLVVTMAGEIVYLFIAHKFHLTSLEYGSWLSLGSFLTAIGLILFLRLFKKWFQLQDATIAIIGVLSRIVGHILFAFSSTKVMLFFVPVVSFLGLTAQASLRSMLTSLVSPHEQGKMYSFVSSLECLAPVFSNLIFNNLYRYTIIEQYWLGWSFIVCALFLVPCLLVFIYLGFCVRAVQPGVSQFDQFGNGGGNVSAAAAGDDELTVGADSKSIELQEVRRPLTSPPPYDAGEVDDVGDVGDTVVNPTSDYALQRNTPATVGNDAHLKHA